MYFELGSYSPELTQVRETLIARVGDLSEKMATPPEQLPLYAKVLDRVAHTIHLPWYKDTLTRAQKSLTQARDRLDVLDTIKTLRIFDSGKGTWRADFDVADREGTEKSFVLGCKMINEHVGRSNWSYYEYYGWAKPPLGRKSDFDYHTAHSLSHTYGWIVDRALAEKQSQRTQTLS